jgi:hypothetical protein
MPFASAFNIILWRLEYVSKIAVVSQLQFAQGLKPCAFRYSFGTTKQLPEKVENAGRTEEKHTSGAKAPA